MVSKGNHPKWPYFRFVNYYNLPIYIYILYSYIYIIFYLWYTFWIRCLISLYIEFYGMCNTYSNYEQAYIYSGRFATTARTWSACFGVGMEMVAALFSDCFWKGINWAHIEPFAPLLSRRYAYVGPDVEPMLSRRDRCCRNFGPMLAALPIYDTMLSHVECLSPMLSRFWALLEPMLAASPFFWPFQKREKSRDSRKNSPPKLKLL